MDEVIDLLDEQGNLTGEVVSKDDAHEKGLWHQSIHILIFNKDNTKILLQKRCLQKKFYPNIWDLSVGGHISSGEEPIVSARRELSEELGLNANDYEINYLTKIKEQLQNNKINSNEYVYVYTINDDIDLNDIVLQLEEVESVKWFTKDELNKLIDDKQIIPHIEEFAIINNILVGEDNE